MRKILTGPLNYCWVAIKIFIIVFFFSIYNYSACADIIHLKNGNDVEGIVIDTAKDTVKVKIKIGTIAFSKEEIESIEESNPKENQALERRWEEEKIQRRLKGEQKRQEPKGEKTVQPEKKSTEEKKIEESKVEQQAVPSRIEWLSFDNGMQKAGNEKKPVMADFYTDWCGWCKKLDSETFQDKTVRSLSTKFVCVKVNADSNKALVKKYGITSYPTIMFFNPGGKPIGRIKGYLPPKEFAEEMKKYIH